MPAQTFTITEEEFRELVAKMMEGLSVPASLGVLGAAYEPWSELYNKLCLFGYPNAEEIKEKMGKSIHSR